MHRYDSILGLIDSIIRIFILQVLWLYHLNVIFVNAGASSTPKNLVNLYTPSESLNVTSSNQFQNEYQHRQASSKATTTDRHKPSTLPLTDGTFDHLTNDLGNLGPLDYSYEDNRVMTNVPDCKGRLKLNGTRGYITDGPGYYQTNLQCIWLIDSGRNNATIRIRFHQFNTECNYDFLYIFDGDSIYSPLVAALSGDMKDFSNAFVEADLPDLISTDENSSINSTTNHTVSNHNSSSRTNSTRLSSLTESRSFELKTNSGKAFIYFHSDTAQSMPGFYMTYSVDSCPLDCSNRGECDFSSLSCRCNPGYVGDGCQYTLCPNNCNSPLNGHCDKTKSCICNEGFTGKDCSKRTEQQSWDLILSSDRAVPPRAFHQSCIVDDTMWIFGGRCHVLSNTNMGMHGHKKTSMVLSFDLTRKIWTETVLEGLTGVDHLAELSGHSIANYGSSVFIYGGMTTNGTILNTLTVFDTKTHSLSSLSSWKKSKHQDEEFLAPLAVTGHSANIIDGNMYIFWGYNPLFGYLNFAQKFNLANNSWTFIERRGSSVSGCIGHTSTFDPVGRLVYVYGGHNALRSNRLYSFDPNTEIWTYLHPGPSPRYYHSAVILNNQLIVLGGNSYNISHQSDQCFQHTYLTYDLNCSDQVTNTQESRNSSLVGSCGCWNSIEESGTSVLKRYGHSIVARDGRELILFGGFNGVLMNDVRLMTINHCSSLTSKQECNRKKLGSNCRWNDESSFCQDLSSDQVGISGHNCTNSEIKAFQLACEFRETCTDCLNTNLGCVWCGVVAQCQYNKCKFLINRVTLNPDSCHKDDSLNYESRFLMNNTNPPRRGFINQDYDNELDCKDMENCYACQSRPHCSWIHDACTYNPPSTQRSTLPSEFMAHEEPLTESVSGETRHSMNSTRIVHKLEPFNGPQSLLDALTSSLLNPSPYTSCDVPCYLRRSCNECTTTKCIWCSTTEQCIDSSAYFAYHSMGQCMHYVAHMSKCPVASCSDIESCDKCLTNPKCGWLSDISNTGKGKCVDGDSSAPLLGYNSTSLDLKGLIGSGNSSSSNNSTMVGTNAAIQNWYYTSCPLCQCNGHSNCKANSGFCQQPCQDNTEGAHCDRCSAGYFGDPVNGGTCKPCRCNRHAQTCNRETGKCYCSVKGLIGHNCNKCDDKNYYIGDPSSPNGTCYYNLTTDYQYTFNMSKPEDHFYSEINFINLPLRKESDADFSIACSRLALVNITSGTSYRDRKPIHTGIECGTFRLRFPHDRHNFSDANYSLFVHVYKFQTPFILQIAFSQQRTLYLPQFFFTFLSCFLFFFALSGLAWKLKHEYDLYVRRQRQFIELEQMASRPFSAILLEMSPTDGRRLAESSDKQSNLEPSPISFEPCFTSNVGVLSVFVQLPGRPGLAVGSALVSLNEDSGNICDEDNELNKRLAGKQQDHTATKNF